MLAFAGANGDIREMAESTPLAPGRFETEATESLSRIKAILSAMLDDLDVRRPVELKKKLKLDVTLCWQIFKVAGDKSRLGSGAVMPSRTSVEKFARLAARNGVGPDRIASLADAYEKFEAVVERHAGDRTSFISLVTAAAGLNEKWLAADLQHRRNMYRGMSHVIGMQAQMRVGTYLITRAANGNGFELFSASGFVGLRTLRDVDLVPVHASRLQGTPVKGRGSAKAFSDAQRRPLNISGNCNLLEDYCSHPLPAVKVDSGKRPKENWVQMSLLRPEVGNLGVITVWFGEEFWFKSMPTALNMVTRLPSEELIQDLIIPRGLIVGQPVLDVFLGDQSPGRGPPDHIPVSGNPEFRYLGTGPGVLKIPNIDRYGDMIAAMAVSASADLNDCEIWRVRVKFPIYQSTSHLSWKLRTKTRRRRQAESNER